MNRYIIVDVESDGGIIGKHSLVCFGAVVLDRGLKRTFYGKTKPISDSYIPEALAVSGFTREQHLTFDEPEKVFKKFADWIVAECGNDRVVLLSDNNGYDASWINWYFLTYLGRNPFGHSSRRIGDMFSGWFNDPAYQWKRHKRTKHDHNPVNDAKGNAEAMLWLIDDGFKLKI